MPEGIFRGKVMWFNQAKGYGFLRPDGGGKDVFIHYSGIISQEKYRNLQPEQIVEFEIGEGSGGRPMAINCRVVST